MRKKGLPIITSVLQSASLLAALFLILYSMPAEAAAPTSTSTAVANTAGVDLSPGYSQTAEPGIIVTYTHVITNNGTTTDTFTVETASSEGWPVELLGGDYPTGVALLPLRLGAGLTNTFVVSLTTPDTAARGTIEYTVVTATSSISDTVQDVLIDTTVVKGDTIYLPLTMRNYPPSWQQADGTNAVNFYDISVCPSNPLLQYAGTTADGLFRSTDGGETWQHWALDGWATPVVVNPLYCAEAFVPVWGEGVYRVTGYDQVVSINQGLDELYLYALALVPDGGTLYLYAGTDTHGVYRTEASSVNWVPINNGIPDLRIRSLYTISDTLYAGSRQCTYYRSEDGGNSWESKTILSGGQGGQCGDARVWAIAQMDNVLYASLGGDKGLHLSADGGTSWTPVPDMSGVTIFRFGLLPYRSRLYVGAYGHSVYTCELDGSCHPLPNRGLGTPNIRGITIAEIPDPRLLAGTDDGVWWVPLQP